MNNNDSNKTHIDSSKLIVFAIWTLYFAAFIGGLSSSLYLPAALHIKHSLHTTTTLVKLALTIYLAGVSIGSITIGPLTDAFGLKRLYVATFSMYVLANLTCAFSQDMIIFIVARFFQGFSAVAGATLSLATLATYLKGLSYKKTTYTLVALISLGPAIGSSLGSFILHLEDNWRFLFILLAISSFLCTIFLYIFLPTDSPSKGSLSKDIKNDFIKLFTNALFWPYCLMAGLGFGCFFLFLSLSPYIFEKFYHWGHLEYTLVGIGAAIGMSGGSIFERLYLENWTPKSTIHLGLFIGLGSSFAIFLAACLFPINGIFYLVLSSISIFGCGLFATTSITKAMANAKGVSNTAAGFVICIKIGVASLISALSPIIKGEPLYAGLSLAIILFVGILLNQVIHREEKA